MTSHEDAEQAKAELLRYILSSPATAPYSRIKYITRYASLEEQRDFLRGLFQRAVEARDTGRWEDLDRYLEDWETRLVTGYLSPRVAQNIPLLDATPWAAVPDRPRSQWRVALISTGGVLVDGQPPYDLKGDCTFREVPRDAPRDRLRVMHPAYDTSGPQRDINCVFPIDRLWEMQHDGAIGEVASTHYGFMGYIPRPEALVRETAPDVARRLKAAGVDAVVIGTT